MRSLLSGGFNISIMQLPGHLQYIGLMGFMNQRCAVLHGLFRVKNSRQRLIGHLDPFQGLRRNFRCGGCDSRHFIPVRTNFLGLQRTIVLIYAHPDLGDIFTGQHA